MDDWIQKENSIITNEFFLTPSQGEESKALKITAKNITLGIIYVIGSIYETSFLRQNNIQRKIFFFKSNMSTLFYI